MTGKPRHLTKNGRVRGPTFTPTDAQRRLVAQLIGLHVTWDEIRLLVIHPKTGEPITKKTLNRYFKRELTVGGAALKQLIASKYYQALEGGESWAVRMGMRNKYNWIVEGAATVAPEVFGVPLKNETLQISFVLPSKKPEDQPQPPIIDASPQREPNYALPAIEGPRPRQRTEFGAVFEQPVKTTDWMK
jgi:hypothetical protein